MWLRYNVTASLQGQAYSATRDQRCLTTFYIHCHAHGDIILDHQQRIVSTMAAVPLSSYDLDAQGRVVNLASGHITAMLHGNGWQAHLTKNEFFSKYEVAGRSEPGHTSTPASGGAAATGAHFVLREGYSAMVLCWDPSNHVPCHGFDLVGGLYAALWALSGCGSALLGRVILVLCAEICSS